MSTKDGQILSKFAAQSMIKAVDEENGTVEAIFSTEAMDRDGDIIRQSHWDLSDFRKHPVLLSSHEYKGLMSQIGELAVKVDRGEKVLRGTATYYTGCGNREADWAFNLAKQGMAAYSVGFIPDMEKAVKLGNSDDWQPSWEFKGQKLLEVSQVTIPSNPDSIQSMKSKSANAVMTFVKDLEEVNELEEPVSPMSHICHEEDCVLSDLDIEKITDSVVARIKNEILFTEEQERQAATPKTGVKMNREEFNKVFWKHYLGDHK